MGLFGIVVVTSTHSVDVDHTVLDEQRTVIIIENRIARQSWGKRASMGAPLPAKTMMTSFRCEARRSVSQNLRYALRTGWRVGRELERSGSEGNRVICNYILIFYLKILYPKKNYDKRDTN